MKQQRPKPHRDHTKTIEDSGVGILNWIILIVVVALIAILLGMAYTHSTERILMIEPNVYKISAPANYYVLVMGINTSEALQWASGLLPEDPSELSISIALDEDIQGERIPSVLDEEFYPIVEEKPDERAMRQSVEQQPEL